MSHISIWGTEVFKILSCFGSRGKRKLAVEVAAGKLYTLLNEVKVDHPPELMDCPLI